MLWGWLVAPLRFLRCRRLGVFGGLGVAFDAGGAFPGVDLIGLGFVFVLDGAVEGGDGVVGLVEQESDLGGGFQAFLVVAEFAGVGGVDGSAEGVEVGDEVGGHFELAEAGAEGRFCGELLWGVFIAIPEEGEEVVGVGGGDVLAVFVRRAEIALGEVGVFDVDGAGGEGDGFEPFAERKDDFLLGERRADLADAGFVEGDDDEFDLREGGGDDPAGCEIGDVGVEEGFDPLDAFKAAYVSIVHGSVLVVYGFVPL